MRLYYNNGGWNFDKKKEPFVKDIKKFAEYLKEQKEQITNNGNRNASRNNKMFKL